LKDPESARFGDGVWWYENQTTGVRYVCVYVNAKNSFGGYNGMKDATVGFKDGRIENVSVGLESLGTAGLNMQSTPCERRGLPG
jgi:hypothetical protein